MLLKKGGQETPIEVLNNLGVLHFERGEFEVRAVTYGYYFLGEILMLLLLLFVGVISFLPYGISY